LLSKRSLVWLSPPFQSPVLAVFFPVDLTRATASRMRPGMSKLGQRRLEDTDAKKVIITAIR
jgi:hypothetical protein